MDWDSFQYNPGSFSKNFSWGERSQGLVRLYEAINIGFNYEFKPIRRSKFRQNVLGKIAGSELIPLNFFLFNKTIDNEDYVMLDELVNQALNFEYSPDFDRLAAYALTLSKVGKWKGAKPFQQYPAMWAKKLISTEIYDGETWRPKRLNSDFIEKFFLSNLTYSAKTPRKFATNLNYIFEQANYDFLETGILEDWWTNALFLNLDRYLMDTESDSIGDIKNGIEILENELFFSLTAISQKMGIFAAENAINEYLEVEELKRFDMRKEIRRDQKTEKKKSPHKPKPSNVKPISRVFVNAQRQIRDRRLVNYLKSIYEHKCIICGNALTVAPGGKLYSEAGHVKPVGKPFQGPDHESNVLIFCPNHHKAFDRGGVRINTSTSRPSVSTIADEGNLNGKEVEILPEHEFNFSYAEWHFNFFQQLYD